MTRPERLEPSKRRPYTRANPAVQLSYSMGNFLTGLWAFYSKRFRSIAKIGGASYLLATLEI